MYSKLMNNMTWYSKGFPLPKPDLNGVCDNFKSPAFMQNSESECMQTFDLENECASVVNPSFFSMELLVYSGVSTYFST